MRSRRLVRSMRSALPWLWIALGLQSPAFADNVSTYAVYEQRLAEHPSVREIQSKAAHYRAMADGARGLPDPQLIVGLDNLPVDDPAFDRFLPSAKVVGFRQLIPNGAVRQSHSAVQQRLATHQDRLAAYQISRLQATFHQQVIALSKIEQTAVLLKRQLALYRLMEKDLSGQLEAGKPVYSRFAAIDVSRVDIQQALNDLRAERANAEAKLVQLIGEVPDVSPLKLIPKAWDASAVNRLLPVRIAADRISIQKSREAVADAQFKPNYGVQAVYKQRESGDNFAGDDWFSIQATVSVPLWSRTNQTPKLQAAQADVRSAQSAYENTIRQWQQTMTGLDADIQVARETLDLLRQKKTSLSEMIAAIERNYESGRVTLDAVIEAQISQLTIEVRLIEQYAKHQHLVAEFNSHIQPDDTP